MGPILGHSGDRPLGLPLGTELTPSSNLKDVYMVGQASSTLGASLYWSIHPGHFLLHCGLPAVSHCSFQVALLSFNHCGIIFLWYLISHILKCGCVFEGV